jgi:hypothetical protein
MMMRTPLPPTASNHWCHAWLAACVAGFLATACVDPPDPAGEGPIVPAFATVGVDNRDFLIPPPGFPERDDAFVTETSRGKSKIKRTTSGAVADATLKDQVPGHVLVYTTFSWNYPQYCVEGENRLPEPGPCRGNGPTDPRDGLIPEALLGVDTWANAIVGETGKVSFHVDLTHDMPMWSSPINGSPGLVNPEGAVFHTYVLDKGPLAPAGPLRDAQLFTLFGGCQGPPAFGPLPCVGVAIAQHLPNGG